MINPDAIGEALLLVLRPEVFAWMAIGVFLGAVVGAIPGLGGAVLISVMLPVTLGLHIGAALGLIIGIYKGSIFGGAISAITFAIPGTPSSAATVFDGYKLMQKGHGRKATEMALTASCTGDLISDIFTIIAAPTIALVALAFGPTERLWLLIIAMVLIGALGGAHLAKGLLGISIGIFIASIGSDPVSLAGRMTFGQWWLADGIPLVPFLIGTFAVAQMLMELCNILRERGIALEARSGPSRSFWKTGERLTFREFRSCWKEMGIGTAIGTFVGMLPALGATAAAFLSYAVAKQSSPRKRIGTGTLEGVAACEAGNNATCGPTFIPLLAFGIPGSTIAALVGATLMLKGATPSPLMFEYYPHIVYALFMVMFVANIFNFGILWPLLRGFVVIGQLPKSILIPLILVFATIGAYASRSNPYDIVIMLGGGLLGFGMSVINIPVAPMVIAFILAPMTEVALRQALIINHGDWTKLLFSSPVSLGLMFVASVVIFITVRYISRMEKAAKQ